MPLQQTDAPQCEECFGYCWIARNEDLLAHYVALLLAGQAAFLGRIASRKPAHRARLSRSALARFRKDLRNGQSEPLRWIRDGWLFQMISWVAVKMQQPSVILRAPHPQASSKGTDTLYVELKKKKGPLLTIGEDKATTKPRGTIRDLVWPEFREFERGEKDPQLNSELSTLLHHLPDAKKLVESALWKKRRRYRVAVTTVFGTTEQQRGKLFKGYQRAVRGDVSRRRADTFEIKRLRKWMNGFARKVAAELAQMKPY